MLAKTEGAIDGMYLRKSAACTVAATNPCFLLIPVAKFNMKIWYTLQQWGDSLAREDIPASNFIKRALLQRPLPTTRYSGKETPQSMGLLLLYVQEVSELIARHLRPYNLTIAQKPMEYPGEHLYTWKIHFQRRHSGMSYAASLPLSVTASMCIKLAVGLQRVWRNIKVPSGDRTIIPFWSCIASQPVMCLTRPGPRCLETAQRRELGSLLRPGTQNRGWTNARQKNRATKPCDNIGSKRLRNHNPAVAPPFHFIIYLIPPISCYCSRNIPPGTNQDYNVQLNVSLIVITTLPLSPISLYIILPTFPSVHTIVKQRPLTTRRSSG